MSFDDILLIGQNGAVKKENLGQKNNGGHLKHFFF